MTNQLQPPPNEPRFSQCQIEKRDMQWFFGSGSNDYPDLLFFKPIDSLRGYEKQDASNCAQVGWQRELERLKVELDDLPMPTMESKRSLMITLYRNSDDKKNEINVARNQINLWRAWKQEGEGK